MIEYNHDTPPERWMMKHELEPIWDGSIDYGASSSRDCLRKNEGTELIGGSRLAVRFVGRNTFVTADRKNHLRKADRKNHLRKRGGGGCAGAPSGRIAGLTDGGCGASAGKVWPHGVAGRCSSSNRTFPADAWTRPSQHVVSR
jgi:hypothetical protein